MKALAPFTLEEQTTVFGVGHQSPLVLMWSENGLKKINETEVQKIQLAISHGDE